MSKKILPDIITVLMWLSAFTCIIGFFILKEHKAVPHIGIALFLLTSIMLAYFNGKISYNVPWTMVISSLGILIVFGLALLLQNESGYDIRIWIQNHAVIFGFALCFFILPPQPLKFYIACCYVLIGCTAILCLVSYIYYIQYLNSGKPIPDVDRNVISLRVNPFEIQHHVLGSFIFASISIYAVIQEKIHFIYSNIERIIVVVLLFLITLYLHVSGARLTLAISYVLFVLIIYFVSRRMKNKNLWFLCGLAFLVLLFSTTVLLSSTFRNRIMQTTTEINAYSQTHKHSVHETFSGRILAFKMAVELLEKYPVKGIGLIKIDSVYNQKYIRLGVKDRKDQLRPHVQFLYYAIAWGIPAAILLALFFSIHLFSVFPPFSVYIFMFVLFQVAYGLTDMPMHLREYYYSYCFWVPFLAHFQHTVSLNKRNE